MTTKKTFKNSALAVAGCAAVASTGFALAPFANAQTVLGPTLVTRMSGLGVQDVQALDPNNNTARVTVTGGEAVVRSQIIAGDFGDVNSYKCGSSGDTRTVALVYTLPKDADASVLKAPSVTSAHECDSFNQVNAGNRDSIEVKYNDVPAANFAPQEAAMQGQAPNEFVFVIYDVPNNVELDISPATFTFTHNGGYDAANNELEGGNYSVGTQLATASGGLYDFNSLNHNGAAIGGSNTNLTTSGDVTVDAIPDYRPEDADATTGEQPGGTPDEKPVDEKPAAEAPAVDEAPAEETPVDEEPAAEAPAVDEAPAEETPVDEAPVDEKPTIDEAPAAEEKPVEEAPADEKPVDEKPTTDEAPADDEKPGMFPNFPVQPSSSGSSMSSFFSS